MKILLWIMRIIQLKYLTHLTFSNKLTYQYTFGFHFVWVSDFYD